MNKPTSENYTMFQMAYDYFNKELFDNKVPDCLITYQRQARTKGYFSDGRFLNTDTQKMIDELAMNPDYFNQGSKDVFATLVHEMCHVYQKYYGKPGRGRYHNKEWANLMLSIDLQPKAIGSSKDGMTGDRVTHKIIPGGKFDLTCDKLIEKIKITYIDRITSVEPNVEGFERVVLEVKRKLKSKNKIKYTCPKCKLNVWGKPEIKIKCGTCDLVLEEETLE